MPPAPPTPPDDADLDAQDRSGPDGPGHVPVLLPAVLELLGPQPGDTALDATLGRGGHAAALVPRLEGGTLIGVDRDADNLAYARRRLAPLCDRHRVTLQLHHASFADLAQQLSASAPASVDVLLADLGFASNQMDDPARGFSFLRDGPLDMRLDPTTGVTAAELVNSLPEKELADLIYRFGEERLSRRIARRLVERRTAPPPIQSDHGSDADREPTTGEEVRPGVWTTHELAEICRRCYPPPHARRGKRRGGGKGGGQGGRGGAGRGIHPATRTFQALRIAVNGELDALDTLLDRLPELMSPGGRAGIISFHSLEDRPVKQALLKLQQDGLGDRLTRRPRTAEDQETSDNPRSRSAKLRAFRFHENRG